MELLSQSALLVGITSFALGTSVLTRNVRNKLYWTFAALCAVITLWAIAFFLENLWGGGNFYRWHLLFNVWLAPFGLALVRVLIRNESVLSRWLFRFSIVASVALTAALLLRAERDPVWLEIVYFSPLPIVIQFIQLMWIDGMIWFGPPGNAKANSLNLARRSAIYIGGLLVLSTSVMDHVPMLNTPLGFAVPVFGNLGLTVYLYFISQAVSQQRLLNFGALATRFGVLLGMALMLTGVYSLVFAWIQRSTALFFLNSFIISFLVLSILEPIRRFVGYLSRRLLTQKHQRLELQVREAQRELSVIIEPGAAYQAIEKALRRFLEPDWSALYALRSDGVRFRLVQEHRDPDTEGSRAEPPREVISGHPLLRYCRRQRVRGRLPVLLDQMLENEIERAAGRSRREEYAALLEAMRALGANLLIPVFDRDTLLGFALASVPQPPEPWGGNWGLLPVVFTYFEQAGGVLRSMEVFARAREKERLAALGEMAAGLAHEIRNPLGAIRGAAQLLDPSADKPESQFLRVIIEEVDRLNRVVTQFLDYSKPFAIEPKPVELGSLVRKTIDHMRPALPAGIRLEFRPPHGPVRVDASAEQLMQVLINIVQNSVHALHETRAPAIEIGLETRRADGEVILYVEDNGKGIRREDIEKLFIPFFTTSPGGTGLGLSISQKIVAAHGGRIEVNSEQGRFTRVSVILPQGKEFEA